MLAVTVILLALLTLAMLLLSRSTLFPPVLYGAIWALTLGALFVSGTIFLPITEYACLVYLVGAVSFAFGGAVCLLCLPTGLGAGAAAGSAAQRSPPAVRVTLDCLLVLLILLFPYFLHLAIALAGTSSPVVMVQYIRQISVEETTSPFGPVANLTVLAPLVALAMTYESDGSFRRRARLLLAVVVALAYSLLTGSKGGAFILMTAFFVTQVRARRISVRTAVVVVGLFTAFFSAGVLAVNMGGFTNGGTNTVEREIGGKVLNYWLGSPVAFSSVAQTPGSLPSSESIDRFFLQTGNSLGMKNSIPSINTSYTVIETDGANSNTYTIYFSYFKDFGWLGEILLLAAIGAMLTWSWRCAMAGGPVAVLLYAGFCTAIFQSIYAEDFFLNLNFYIKSVILYLAIYRGSPPLLAALSPRAPHGAGDRELA